MKKKILFICSNLNIGGFQKSLIAALKCFDYQKYDIDLLLMSEGGIFLSEIPKEVNILSSVVDDAFLSSLQISIKLLLKKRKIKLLVYRLFVGCANLINKGTAAWLMSRKIAGLKKHYDAAIDYNGQYLLYYLVDKVNANIKISYFHSDYKKWRYYEKVDRKYYSKVDAIVTVSDQCVASMQEIFPEFANKILCIENIVSPKTLNYEDNSCSFYGNYDGFKIITVGRVCADKGLEYAIEACNILIKRGIKFKWIWIGPFDKNDKLISRIKTEGVSDNLLLVGPSSSPYKSMSDADIMVHPSKYEGKSVTVEEAKVLSLPIVATNYSTVHDQIVDGKSGVIVEMNSTAVASAIEDLASNPSKIKEMRDWMKVNCNGNESEIAKLYALIERK